MVHRGAIYGYVGTKIMEIMEVNGRVGDAHIAEREKCGNRPGIGGGAIQVTVARLRREHQGRL